MLAEQKGTLAVLVLVAVVIGITLWRTTGNPFLGIASVALLMLSIWRSFVPAHFEINPNGIVRWTFGKKKFIPWEEIRSYQILKSGILLFPHSNSFPLEPFRGFFLPVPDLVMEDVKKRFQVRGCVNTDD